MVAGVEVLGDHQLDGTHSSDPASLHLHSEGHIFRDGLFETPRCSPLTALRAVVGQEGRSQPPLTLRGAALGTRAGRAQQFLL